MRASQQRQKSRTVRSTGPCEWFWRVSSCASRGGNSTGSPNGRLYKDRLIISHNISYTQNWGDYFNRKLRLTCPQGPALRPPQDQ
jgi:hypothetical protein